MKRIVFQNKWQHNDREEHLEQLIHSFIFEMPGSVSLGAGTNPSGRWSHLKADAARAIGSAKAAGKRTAAHQQK